MTKIFTSILLLITLIDAEFSFSQWTNISNNQINWEIQVSRDYYGGGADGIDPVADPTVRTDININGQGWLGESCFTYEGYPPIYNSDNSTWYGGTYYAFNTQFSTWIGAWESDNSDECTYTSGDDDYYSGYGLLRDGQTSMPFTYPSTDFYPCHWNPYLGNGGSTWLYQQIYDQELQMTWRYVYGGDSGNCLNFDNITNIFKSDVNSNQSVSTVSGYALQYVNTLGNTSADVWYAFNITSPCQVSLSTDYDNTNFDTYIRLFDTAGNELMVDDDGGALGNTSTLSTQLCAGTYKFCVEGYSSNTGVFKVSASATTLPAITITTAEVGSVECPDDIDGYVYWNVSNYIGSYSIAFDDVWSGQATGAFDLGVGSHDIYVVDQCGSSALATINIVNNDNTPPTALCAGNFSVTAYPNDPAEITINDIDDGSFDNCGIQDIIIGESNFVVSEEGPNIVTMSVIDISGNTSTCTTTVNVEVGVGIEEENTLNSFDIIPNPNNGSFKLSLLSQGTLPDTHYQIHDVTGRIYNISKLNTATQDIVLNGAAPGVYFITIDQKGSKSTRRFIVE